MRLIDADKLLERVDKERQYLLARGQKGAEHILVHNFRDLIDEAPTVPLPDFKEGYKQAILDGKTNYSRLQGKWINETKITDKRMFFRCSHCNAYDCERSNYCPNCGADMRGSEV